MPALVKSASRRPRTNGGVLVIMYSLICDLCDIARAHWARGHGSRNGRSSNSDLYG